MKYLFGCFDGVDDGAYNQRINLDCGVQRNPTVVVFDLQVRHKLQQRVDRVPVTKSSAAAASSLSVMSREAWQREIPQILV